MSGPTWNSIRRLVRPSMNGKMLPKSTTTVGKATGHSIERKDLLARAWIFQREGQFGNALRTLNLALVQSPSDEQLAVAKGGLLFQWGRYLEAFHYLQTSQKVFPNSIDICARLGWSALRLGNATFAAEQMELLVKKAPHEAEANFALGCSQRECKKFEEALQSFERVLQIKRDHSAAATNIAKCHLELEQYSSAEQVCRQNIAIIPTSAIDWLNLAVALHKQDKSDALDAYARAYEFDHGNGDELSAFASYASYLRSIGRVAEAIAIYRKCLPSHPDSKALAQYGMCLLHLGEYEHGWDYYEFRWLQEPLVSLRGNLEIPWWLGQDLENKTIFIRSEQGIGDVIQFVRYCKFLKLLGARVIVLGREGIGELAAGFQHVDEFIQPGSPLPKFDYYTNMMSLPRLFGGGDPSLVNFDAPAIDVDENVRRSFESRFRNGGKVNVGLVWAGNPNHLLDRYRSIQFSDLAAFAQIENVNLISLQKGPAVEQLRQSNIANCVLDLEPELENFAVTAAAIAALDLVISVDTSVAHLAGSLGKSVWILLPTPSEWRWQDARSTTPWYSSARLFRQRSAGNWQSVINDVITALGTLKPTDADSRSQAGMALSSSFQKPKFKPITVEPAFSGAGEMREGIFHYAADAGTQGRYLQVYGEWMHDRIALLASLIKLGQVVLEVNAEVGAHSIPLSRLVGPNGLIFVSENDARLRRMLTENLAANRIGHATVLTRPLVAEKLVGEGPAACPCDTVDDYIFNRLDWLIINSADAVDIALEGAKETLWTCRPRMVLDVGDDTGRIYQHVRNFGYRCWVHEGRVARDGNFNRAPVEAADSGVRKALLCIPEEIEMDIEIPCDEWPSRSSLGPRYPDSERSPT